MAWPVMDTAQMSDVNPAAVSRAIVEWENLLGAIRPVDTEPSVTHEPYRCPWYVRLL